MPAHGTEITADDVEIIGGLKNFLIHSKTHGYDISPPATPGSPKTYPRIPLETSRGMTIIDPTKTALVVIDLQNYFLSPLLGRPRESLGMKVKNELLKVVIPACRKVDIPVVWLGWALSEDDLNGMPAMLDANFDGPKGVGPLNSEIGPLNQDDGTVIQGGRVMMKDQCVGGSLQDAFTKGFDCLMLQDACATTSPEFARQCIGYNCGEGWGFVLTCKQMADGVEKMQTSLGGGGES